ncbi:MAG: BON domain-containing protein [Proteobacteria bacterium]|nr:BON domain-containing protein [Pseudomonadota bacterium]
MNAQTAFILFLAVVAVAVVVTRLRPARKDSDLAITAAVNSAILGDFRFSSSQIDVKTFDGVVILGGFTREHELMQQAVELASAIPGVKSVDNRISIRSGH